MQGLSTPSSPPAPPLVEFLISEVWGWGLRNLYMHSPLLVMWKHFRV